MSFASFASETNTGPSAHAEPISDLAQIVSETSHQLQTYSSLISTFANERKLIGSRRDGPDLRDKLDESQASIKRLGDAIQTLLSNVNTVVNSESVKVGHGDGDNQSSPQVPDNQKGSQDSDQNGSQKNNQSSQGNQGRQDDQDLQEPQGRNQGRAKHGVHKSGAQNINGQVMMKDRIVSEFTILQGTFQALVRDYQAKKRANALPETAPLLKVKGESSRPGYVQANGAHEQPASGQGPAQSQEQVQEDQVNESDLQYHVALTEERNRQIEQVQNGIREVNSIFKDLGELVNSQGSQLDTVEENILHMSGNAYSADRELSKANEYQKRKSKWSCILLCALCVFVLVVVLAVLS